MSEKNDKTEKKPPNWVAERAKCTIEGAFEELYMRVKEDVCALDSVRYKKKNRVFDVERKNDNEFVVCCFRGNPPKRDPDGIRFYRNLKYLSFRPTNEDESIVVTMKWNQKNVRCDYFIDGKKVEMWQISQRALCEFFFEK